MTFEERKSQVLTEMFLKSAKEKHGDKYDYSKVKLTKKTDKICIICRLHGEFYQNANHHLTISPKFCCPNRPRKEKRIPKLKPIIPPPDEIGVNGKKYWIRHCPKCNKILRYVSYGSKSDAEKRKCLGICCAHKEHSLPLPPWFKSCIDCKIDVEFITVQGMLSTKPCRCEPCRVENQKNIFLENAKKKYGDKFDYSKMKFTLMLDKVTIICPTHGEFLQTPQDHLSSKFGCVGCYKQSLPPKKVKIPKPLRVFKPKKVVIPRVIIQPDEIVNGVKMWVRYCPDCKGKIYSKNHWSKMTGEKLKRKCGPCSRKGRIRQSLSNTKASQSLKLHWNNKRQGAVITQYMNGNVYLNNNGNWCRKCPQCKQETQYSKKENAFYAEKRKSICRTCAGSGQLKNSKLVTTTLPGLFLNAIKQWCRNCPSCNQIIQYNSKYWATKAQKNGTGCYDCYSSSHISKCESAFLDYFNIQNRQTQVGIYRVDGLKGNVVYEFLGDFWHGNPNRYNMNDTNKVAGETFKKLYDDTIIRFQNLKLYGYDVKYIWESDWTQFTKDKLLDNSKFRVFNGIDLLT